MMVARIMASVGGTLTSVSLGVSSAARVGAIGRGGTHDNEVLADGRRSAVALVQHPRGRPRTPRRVPEPADIGAADTARPDAHLPHGDHRAGGVDRALDRDPRSCPRHLQDVAPDAAVPGHAPREGARYPRPNFLQVRRDLAGGVAQAQHRGRAGLLQRRGGHQAPDHGDRRRAVGIGARVRRRSVRPRGHGLHGQGLVPAEAVPACTHGDVGRQGPPLPDRSDRVRPQCARESTGLAGKSRHRHLGGGRGRGNP